MPKQIEKHELSAQMPVIRSFLIQFVATAATTMLVAKSTQLTWVEAFAVGVLVSALIVASVGAFWMIWAAFRHAHPIPKVIVAIFVPFAFVWYYLERASQVERGHLTRVIRILLSAVAGVMFVTFIAHVFAS